MTKYEKGILMHRLQKGDEAPHIILPDSQGGVFMLDNYRGRKVLISFYRFATCPFCNLRIHAMVRNYEKYHAHFEMIAIFESKSTLLKQTMMKHDAPFLILSDQDAIFYRSYGLEKSFMGVIKGMMFRMPSLFKSMMMGNLPINIDSPMTRMPADFLIDENGLIEIAYYGNDEGDHLDIDSLLKSNNLTNRTI